MEESGVFGGSVEIMAISDIYKASVGVYLAYGAKSLSQVKLRIKEVYLRCLVVLYSVQ
jgi:hypothetical protein